MKIQYLIVPILGTLNISCVLLGDISTDSIECSKYSHFFLNLPVAEQEIRFSQYNLESQYAIYLCGRQKIHPRLHLEIPFSKRGGEAMPFLKEKLIETRNDLTVRDIIYLFSWMQRNKTYNVYSDKVLMQLMKIRESGIRDHYWQRHTQNLIKEIEALGENRVTW